MGEERVKDVLERNDFLWEALKEPLYCGGPVMNSFIDVFMVNQLTIEKDYLSVDINFPPVISIFIRATLAIKNDRMETIVNLAYCYLSIIRRFLSVIKNSVLVDRRLIIITVTVHVLLIIMQISEEVAVISVVQTSFVITENKEMRPFCC